MLIHRAYAIVGACIVPRAGLTIETGTVVLRDGVIEAVGADVVVPGDAEIIEGDDLTVYPGLIDLGNACLVPDRPSQPPQDLTTLDELAEWKRLQYLRPHVRAGDDVPLASRVLTTWADAGVTSLLALPSRGVISGQSALIEATVQAREGAIGALTDRCRPNVGGRRSLALHVSFFEGQVTHGIAFPASGMGVVAFVRQAFQDARHYALTRPRRGVAAGTAPLPDDPRLEAMRDAVERRMLVAFDANTPSEILRALRMAREQQLDPIIVGGHEAHEVAAELAAADVPVIYSVNYPVRPATLGPGQESLRALRSRLQAPILPSELARAGVRFAFASSGLEDPRQFIANVRKAVAAGLSPESALHALTAAAADIAREAQRIGTIEPGKSANLVITNGDLFDPITSVMGAFVRGRRLELRRCEEKGGRRRTSAD
jgi:imidazolonepropionase-like amidohydrolase